MYNKGKKEYTKLIFFKLFQTHKTFFYHIDEIQVQLIVVIHLTKVCQPTYQTETIFDRLIINFRSCFSKFKMVKSKNK